MVDLSWLPSEPAFSARLARLREEPAWGAYCDLARTRLDAVSTRTLDRAFLKQFPTPPPELATVPVNLAILASSTIDQLVPAIRMAALRRGIWANVVAAPYGQHVQALIDPQAVLNGARPDAILFSFDARHFLSRLPAVSSARETDTEIAGLIAELAAHWDRARSITKGQILQQALLPVSPPLLGENEHRLPGSPLWILQRLNMELRARADAERVDVIAVDAWCARHGLGSWHDPALWHRAKQEIHPNAAPFYGDLVARLLAAAQGLSSKALVLDLDNTLWGGVIGEDGLAGIVLGPGSAAGEAFAEFQGYVRALGRRGVILAVCSKNEESNALEPFEKHPEMILKRDEIACLVANWDDKATNLRGIAATLNLGLDSFVFVDDNPAERDIVRRELPMVAVPELPTDVSLFPAALSEAGYFEGRQVTNDDLARGRQYQANAARTRHVAASTDMEGYLRSLEMRAIWGRFDADNKARIVQLVNKTNQFNLTTRRITDSEVDALIDDTAALTAHIRLVDRFGDNGIIAVVIGAFAPGTRDMELHTWLMSCRVLGRGVENSTLNIIAEQARRLGAERLIGVYRPSAKNAMVRDHYVKLGFESLDADGTRFALDLGSWDARATCIETEPQFLTSTSERT